MVQRVQNQFTTQINRIVDDNKRVSGRAYLGFSEVMRDRISAAVTPTADWRGRGASGSAFKFKMSRAHHTPGSRGARGISYRNITMTHARRLAEYAPMIQEASRKYGVPVELICAVILQESGGNFRATSYCGARGLMQLMPGTARRMGVANAYDPYQNIMGGTRYLRFLLDRFRGNFSLAVAAYNSGEGNVEKYGNRIPPFRETQAYVPNVLSYANAVGEVLRAGGSRVVDAARGGYDGGRRFVPSVIIPSHSKKA